MGKSTQAALPGRITSLQKRERALELRARGLTYHEVGLQLGIAKQAAHRLVKKALEDQLRRHDEAAEHVKALELRRLDAELRRLEPIDDLRAAEIRLKISERRAKLLGLDAPAKTELLGKDGTQLVPPVINIGFANGGPGSPGPGAEGS